MPKIESKSYRLKDVALKAGVSPSTASMVFNRNGRISPQIRQHVLDVASTMNYHHPRRKSTNNGNCAALLMSLDKDWSFIWHFLAPMITRLEQELSDRLDMQMILLPISKEEPDSVIRKKIKKSGSDALFSVHICRPELFEILENDGIPVTLIFNSQYQNSFFSVCVDNFQGAYDGTRYLLQLGHRRILFIDGIREDLPLLSVDRFYGFRKAMEESGCSVSDLDRIIFEMDVQIKDLAHTLSGFLKLPKPPTAFFCLDDEIALMVWAALRELKYSIPQDISILAPGDVLDYSKVYTPSITTMQIDMSQAGHMATEILYDRIKNGSQSVNVIKIKQHLVQRDSSQQYES